MNANELADSLEAASSDMEYNFHVSDWKLLYECALVMRKQQAEIGFYKQDADKYKLKCASQQAEIEALKSEREIMFGFVKSRGEIGQLIMYKAALEQNQ